MPKYILIAFLLLISGQCTAQKVYGTISYRTRSNESRPDSGATIVLCQRAEIDISKISLKESLLEHYRLSNTGNTVTARKHKRKLALEFDVHEETDLNKYIRDAAKEEAKIADLPTAIVTRTDNSGFYSLRDVKDGFYFLHIKSTKTHQTHTVSFDVKGQNEYVVDREFNQ